jgi:hypothetical protein
MGKIKKTLPINKIYFLILIITLLIGVPPFVLYGSARLTGELPSYQEWLSYHGNHGPWSPPRTLVPWWALWKGDLIVNSSWLLVVLSVVTFLLSIILGLNASTKRFLTFIKGIGLVLLQLLWVYMIMLTMFWTLFCLPSCV